MKKKLEPKSIGPLKDDDSPWNGITLNRCLVVAAIAALLSMGFQVLQDAVDSDDDFTRMEAEVWNPLHQNEQLTEASFFEGWFGSSKAQLPEETETLNIEESTLVKEGEIKTHEVEQQVSTIQKKAKPEPWFFESWFDLLKSELPAAKKLESELLKTEEQKVLPMEEAEVLSVKVSVAKEPVVAAGEEPIAPAPAVEEPVAPASEWPVAPAVEEPVAPAVEEPVAPAAEEPVAPAAVGPVTPAFATEVPVAPAAEGPVAPAAEGPGAPAAEGPVAPAAEGPVAPAAEKQGALASDDISTVKIVKIKEMQADVKKEKDKKDKKKSNEQWGLKAKGKYMAVKAAKIRRAAKNGSNKRDVFPFFKKRKELTKPYPERKKQSYKDYQTKMTKRKYDHPQKQEFGKSFKKDIEKQNKYHKHNNERKENKYNKKYHQEKKKNQDFRYPH